MARIACTILASSLGFKFSEVGVAGLTFGVKRLVRSVISACLWVPGLGLYRVLGLRVQSLGLVILVLRL